MAWLSACATLRDLTPHGPVLGYAERLEGFSGAAPTPVLYTSAPAVPFPVVPLQVFGVTYDLDIVLRSRHPDWDMHEYARVTTPDGPLWLCKDARAGTLAQSIVADLGDAVHTVLPEVPVERRASPVRVEDRSTPGFLEVSLAYTNLDGQPVEVSYAGPLPTSAQGRRNTSTMGHSRDAVAAVLDLSHRAFARTASLTIGGERQRIERVLGLVPFQLVLVQTQAGFSVGSLRWEAAADGALRTEHTAGPVAGARQGWSVRGVVGGVEIEQVAPWRTVTYRFRDGADGAAELAEASVRAFGQPALAAHVVFEPAVPDLRRRFDGEVVGAFVVDVNGQPAHGVGAWRARWTEGGPVLELSPEAPAWFADRPMITRVSFPGDGHAEVTIERAP